MMLGRKRMLQIVFLSVIIVVALIVTFLILYLKTDSFKSSETLFLKYVSQNSNILKIVGKSNYSQVKQILNNNIYDSNLEGTVEYTENIGTSNENKDNSINNLKLNIETKVDNTNDTKYRNIKFVNEKDEELAGLEYISDGTAEGIRLLGIKQFLSGNEKEFTNLIQEIGMENVYNLQDTLEQIDLDSILNFSEEEKNTLTNKYMTILKNNLTKNMYAKQKNAGITIDNKSVNTNAYIIQIPYEKYNELYVKILEELSKDETILSKVDNFDSQTRDILEKVYGISKDKSLRDILVEKINAKIDEIQSTNIGNEVFKITVYENKGVLVRTIIDKSVEKITIDISDNSIKIDDKTIGNTEIEKIYTLEKNVNAIDDNFVLGYEDIENNETLKNININYNVNIVNNNINKDLKVSLANQKYSSNINIKDTIDVGVELEDQSNYAEDIIKINSLNDETKNLVLEALKQNFKNQVETANLNEYYKMFQNLGIIPKDGIVISDTGNVTETQKNRFNSQFEFFESTGLTYDNINELLNAVKDNFSNAKAVIDLTQEEDIDVYKLSQNNEETDKYKKSLTGVNLYIKGNTTNDEKLKSTAQFFEKLGTSQTYDVELKYNEKSGLVEVIKIKLVKK